MNDPPGCWNLQVECEWCHAGLEWDPSLALAANADEEGRDAPFPFPLLVLCRRCRFLSRLSICRWVWVAAAARTERAA